MPKKKHTSLLNLTILKPLQHRKPWDHATTKRFDLIWFALFNLLMMNLNTKFFLWYNQPKHYGKLKSFNIFNSIPSLLTNMEKLESASSGSMLFNLLDSIPTSKSTKQYQKRISQSKSAYLATHKSISEFKFDKLIGLCKFLHVFVWSGTKHMVSSPKLTESKINLLPWHHGSRLYTMSCLHHVELWWLFQRNPEQEK